MNFKRTSIENGEYSQVDFGQKAKLVQKTELAGELSKERRQTLLRILENLSKAGDKVEENGMKVEYIEQGIRYGRYYKLDVDGKNYFLKYLPTRTAQGGGAQEVLDMVEVNHDIQELEGVEVVDYKFGYQDKNHMYSISAWDESLRKNMRVQFETGQIDYPKAEGLWKRVDMIQKHLGKKYYDVDIRNMAYNPEADKIIIFDLIKKPDWHVG
jgi:hypothetical protein